MTPPAEPGPPEEPDRPLPAGAAEPTEAAGPEAAEPAEAVPAEAAEPDEAAEPADPPRRVAVTSPRTTAVRHPAGRLALRALDEQDVVGELLVRSLVRAQLFLALRMLTVLGVLLGGLPLLFAVVPATRDVQLLGLPLPWLVLGVLVHPALVVGGLVYLRLAERNEREFADLVERP